MTLDFGDWAKIDLPMLITMIVLWLLGLFSKPPER